MPTKIGKFFKGLPVRGVWGKFNNSVRPQRFMKKYIRYLKYLGINFVGSPNYISPDVYFDSHDYSLITIGNDSVISMGVTLLTHDYSIARGIQAIKGKTW